MKSSILLNLTTTVILALFPIFNNINNTKTDMKSVDTKYEIGINEVFSIELISNPSTGYSWVWINEDTISIVKKISSDYVPDQPDAVGGGGIETWKLEGIKTGTETLKLEYKRAWEANSPIESKEIIVTVK